jgi:hypothetical protein
MADLSSSSESSTETTTPSPASGAPFSGHYGGTLEVTPEPATTGNELEGLEALDASLANALDEDDLPEPRLSSGPPVEAATARPEAAASMAPVYGLMDLSAAAAPEPVPAPAATVVSELAAEVVAEVAEVAPVQPSVATSYELPPLRSGGGSSEAGSRSDGEGGEWEVLVDKVNTWFGSGELQEQWQKLRGPLRGGALLLGALLALKIYDATLDTLDDLPLVPRLLQLVGVITLAKFAVTRLVRTSERERVLATWRQRWEQFRG